MNLFACLKHFDPMFGRDLHTVWPPGAPSASPVPGPHLTTSTLMGVGLTASMAKKVFTHFGWSMQRGTDIGPMITHIGLVPNMLSPLLFIASASKSRPPFWVTRKPPSEHGVEPFAPPSVSAIFVVAALGSIVLLSFSMKALPLGTAYAIWTGIGAVGSFVIGIVVLGETASALRIGAAVLIVSGLVLMKLSSES